MPDTNINRFGKTSTLRLSAASKDGKTIIDDVYFTSPYKILPPFYNDNSQFASTMIISVSAGLMEGDRQDVFIHAKENANLLCTSQAFEKIHKMNNGEAGRTIKLTVDSNATLWYEPLPVIPFADSAFTNQIDISLNDNTSRFALTDIISAGRIAHGEAFKYKYYNSLINAYIGDELVFFDNTRYSPRKSDLNGLGMFEKHSHLATVLLLNFLLTEREQSSIYEKINENPEMTGGISAIEHGFIIKVLGNNAQQLQNVTSLLKHILNIL
ncbi:MAG: urease accessory protein UreD [Christensenellales bacterium]